MELPFFTIQIYAGKSLPAMGAAAAAGGGHTQAWEEESGQDHFPLIFAEVSRLLEAKGEKLQAIARLQYEDPKPFSNTVFRIEGSKECYFLKILGEGQGNRREVFVWKVIGYGDDGKRAGGGWIRGLPPEVFPMARLNSVLTRFYPGQLRPLRGGSYEFPLVVALVLYLHETLERLHEMGLVYMDLCPENVLYLERSEDSPISFFLTDMGSVKPISGKSGSDENWRELLASVTEKRLTRVDTRPPETLFPEKPGAKTEDRPGYDFHTLARTAYILLGLGSDPNPDREQLEGFSSSFHLERPLEPTRAELAALLEALEPAREGRPLDTQSLYRQFVSFFTQRAGFVSDYLDEPGLASYWQDLLNRRLNRYRMVLSKEDKSGLAERLKTMAGEEGEGGAKRDLALLCGLPSKLECGDLEGAAADLQALASSSLLRVSPTARYSYSFHRKVLRNLARGRTALPAHFPNGGAHAAITAGLEQIPEKETIEALRRRRDVRFGILKRALY